MREQIGMRNTHRLVAALLLGLLGCSGGGRSTPAPATPTTEAKTFACGSEQCPDSNFCMKYEQDDKMVALCRPTPDGCAAPAQCDCLMQLGLKAIMCADDGGTHSVVILAAPP